MWSTAKSDVNDSFPTQWLNLSWLQAAMRITCIQQMFWRIKCCEYSHSSFKHKYLMYLNLVPRHKKNLTDKKSPMSFVHIGKISSIKNAVVIFLCSTFNGSLFVSVYKHHGCCFLSGSFMPDINWILHQCCCRVSLLF